MTGSSTSVETTISDIQSIPTIKPTEGTNFGLNTLSRSENTLYNSGTLPFQMDGKLTIQSGLIHNNGLRVIVHCARLTKTFSSYQEFITTLSEELWTSLMREWGGETSTLNFLLGMPQTIYEDVPESEKLKLQKFLETLLIRTVSTPPAEIPTSLAITD